MRETTDAEKRPQPASPSSAARDRREPRPRDPRLFQIAALGGLLAYGVLALDLDLRPAVVFTLAATALGVQAVATRLVGLPRFDPRSALISTLSLCLLLRTPSPALAAAVAAITIASKFVIRARGKHVFNPTNFGLVAGLLLFDGLWVSPGQWGSAAFVGFLAACAGALVVHRSRRSDVTWAFLGAWTALLFGRAAWLGDPWAIPLHQLQSGALVIFAFFMISDPKTTPDSRPGRVLWACLVAALAGYIRFGLFEPSSLLWALVLCAPAVPLVDRLLPAERYAWPSAPTFSPTSKTQPTTEPSHDTTPPTHAPHVHAPHARPPRLPA